MIWRKILLVHMVFVVGCTAVGALVTRESKQDFNSEESTEQIKTPILNSAPQNLVKTQPSISLPNLGSAPAWTNDVWLNTDQPLFLENLRGSVVLLEMWTFG